MDRVIIDNAIRQLPPDAWRTMAHHHPDTMDDLVRQLENWQVAAEHQYPGPTSTGQGSPGPTGSVTITEDTATRTTDQTTGGTGREAVLYMWPHGTFGPVLSRGRGRIEAVGLRGRQEGPATCWPHVGRRGGPGLRP